MERQVWLAERWTAPVAAYDTEAATSGDEEYPRTCSGTGWPSAASDPARWDRAGCAVRHGYYFPMLAAAGHRVLAADQSAGMLAQARARAIAFSLEHISLQDLSPVRQLAAVLTIDAMEHIPPRRLARRAGQFAPGCPAGWPVVPDDRGTGAAPYRAGLRGPFCTRVARGAGRGCPGGCGRLPLSPGS